MPEFHARNTPRARSLRNSATISEKRLWLYLNKRQRRGHRFSRQIPIGPYFCDFLCREACLVVEVDGDTHDYTVEHDQRRDAFMRKDGYRILRFQNEDIRDGLESVLLKIDDALLEWEAAQAHPGSAS
ncbi:endonuclease domain-containing protein [Sphingomonas sp. 35-24ZXX]|uniref:endonuclease domain-containing protein n=1 Tax=Sphingomonas sp. 35-24ZXX TaxID=1545915 RepID=UPI00053BEAEE|nr:endonuclease domain-containing protein [Sphingomonas sp. 35-24ZXX]